MNKKNILDLIDISNKDIVTVVGAGGKTSFINYISKLYKDSKKVLLTTTTKIYTPDKSLYNKIHMLEGSDFIELDIDNNSKGVVVIGKCINKEGKIVGLNFSDLDKVYKKFDLILIEGDGSKRKKLKGWNEFEPVVYEKTTKTIGILDITAYDMDINEDNIHRLEEFEKITNIKNNNKVTIENLCDVVLNDKGMFKNSIGEKILFINKVENDYYKDLAKKLINNINSKSKDIKIVYGSIINSFE